MPKSLIFEIYVPKRDEYKVEYKSQIRGFWAQRNEALASKHTSGTVSQA